MRIIRILIADDSSTDTQDLLKSLNAYFKAKKISTDSYEILTTDSIDETLQIITSSEPFDIFFVDINFSEKDNDQRTGYLLVRKAFEYCPLTFICVYSGTADEDVNLQKEYVDLLKRGMLADIFKKNFFMGSTPSEFNNRFKRAWNFVRSKQFIWDIWNNQELILTEIQKDKLHIEVEENENRKSEIKKNFEAVLFLLRNIDLLSSRVIVYRLCLQLYHRCLEIYLSQGSDDEIITKSDTNKASAENLLRQEKLLGKEADGTDRSLILGDRSSALRKIVAYSTDNKLKYGYLMNKYRNKSVHPDSIFEPELTNVIFSNLALSLYVLAKNNKINYQILESSLNEGLFKGKGEKDLVELIGYLNNDS